MKKVIIIGAGPAGITAANELLKDTNGEYDVTTAIVWTLAVTVFFLRATR